MKSEDIERLKSVAKKAIVPVLVGSVAVHVARNRDRYVRYGYMMSDMENFLVGTVVERPRRLWHRRPRKLQDIRFSGRVVSRAAEIKGPEDFDVEVRGGDVTDRQIKELEKAFKDKKAQ